MPVYKNVELVTDALSIVAESPLWDEKNNILYYVDIQGKRLRAVNWSDGRISDLVLPQQIGCIAFDTDGNLIGGMEDGIYEIKSDGSTRRINKPFKMSGLRFNDGKAGPDGKYYAGTYGINNNGAFYRMDTDGTMTQLLAGVGNANGLCWDITNNLFYFNDTPTLKTSVFDFENGNICHRRTLTEYADTGRPDGMTIDCDGMLWVALWGGYKVVRINPCTGKIIDSIDLPVANVASCTFGGEKMDDLIITTSSHMTVLREEPLAGSVFMVKTNTCGMPSYRYKAKQ